MSDLATYLRRIPFLAGAASSAATAQRLAGLTNLNFLVESNGERFVVRVPGAGTAEYVNRQAECVAARAASDAGVNAPVVFFDPHDGLMVTRFVEHAVTMNADLFTDLGAVARAGRAFHKLHTTSKLFATEFRLFPMIDEYKSLLASKAAALPAGYDELQVSASATRVALERTPAPLVPSHCDPLCENFLDTGELMVLIDYEYAGNNDPMWDLGDLSVEGGFTAEQDRTLMHSYFGHEPPAAQVGRMVAYKAMCDLLWTLWGAIQHVNANPADDFWGYAVNRFERCRTLMSSAEYAVHIANIA